MIYYIRLDDACEKRDIVNWNRIESILDKYGIKPLVGVIPNCLDEKMEEYEVDNHFWEKVDSWVKKGWEVALHGFTHVFETDDGGINPVNKRSEFAGLSIDRQKEKIKKGIEVFNKHNINPRVFFAPAHTFDMNTLKALEEESSIRIISDTIANKPYNKWGFTFIPQQSGHVRKLPFKYVTFCYHPNTMTDRDFEVLEEFIIINKKYIQPFKAIESKRKYSFYDRLLNYIYYKRRK